MERKAYPTDLTDEQWEIITHFYLHQPRQADLKNCLCEKF